jgi:hypothetical protein
VTEAQSQPMSPAETNLKKETVAITSIAVCACLTGDVATLFSTPAIRSRANGLLTRARAGQSEFFSIDGSAMASAAQIVADVTRERYPNLAIPYHSRWRHFEVGGVNRLASFNDELGKVSVAKRARAQIDLAVVSVLLDAGSGPDWRYEDARSGKTFSRSEGLGVASFNAFTTGLFSSKPTQPLQADAAGLMALSARQLGEAFQVSKNNLLVGLEGRATLLRRLGEVMAAQPEVFGGAGGQCRPGRLYDHLLSSADASANEPQTIAASQILAALLATLSPIWPAQNAIQSGADHISLGDCWQHPQVPGTGADDITVGWMPFHKLSQWLTYSLLEPFESAGVNVTGLDALTGLPEYRNGGLFVDAGVIQFKDPAMLAQTFKVGDAFVVEWRALTVALLDELAPLVRANLGLSAEQMPLACVLEGGTWAAGRMLAQQLRGGKPPINIDSDGTVF